MRPSYQSWSREAKDYLMSNDSYTVFIKGKKVYSNLNVYEYMDIMENLSLEFYQTGSPRPSDIETKIFNELKGLIDG